MTKWLGRLGAALLIAIAGTGLFWFSLAIVIWLDTMVPAGIMIPVAGVIFVLTVIADTIIDWLKAEQNKRNVYDAERYAALTRGDDEL